MAEALGTDEEQVGHVRADDEEHEEGGGLERHEPGTQVAHEVLPDRHGQGVPSGVRVRILLGEPVGDRFELRLRFSPGDSGRESADGDEMMALAPGARQVARVESEGPPEVGLAKGGLGARPQDPDQGMGFVVERQGPAEDLGVAAVAPHPQAVADQDHLARLARQVVCRKDGAPQ